MAPGFWRSSLVVDVAEIAPEVAVFDQEGRFLATGGYGWARVLSTADGSTVWQGCLQSRGAADEDAGVVRVAGLSGSGAWALFATSFHTGATGSRGLFLVDVTKGEVVELDAGGTESFVAAAFTADERKVLVATPSRLCFFDVGTKSETAISLPWRKGAVAEVGETALVCLSNATALLAGRGHLFEIDIERARATSVAEDAGAEQISASGVTARIADGAVVFAGRAVGSRKAPVWRYRDRALDQVALVAGEVVWSAPDGLTLYLLAESGLSDGGVRRVEVVTDKSKVLRWPEELEVDPDELIRVFAVSPDGTRLAFAEEGGGLVEELFLISSPAGASPRRAAAPNIETAPVEKGKAAKKGKAAR